MSINLPLFFNTVETHVKWTFMEKFLRTMRNIITREQIGNTEDNTEGLMQEDS